MPVYIWHCFSENRRYLQLKGNAWYTLVILVQKRKCSPQKERLHSYTTGKLVVVSFFIFAESRTTGALRRPRKPSTVLGNRPNSADA